MATKYAQQSGDWSNDTSVWYDAESGGSVVSHPVEGDNAIINTGIEVSMDNESGVIVVGDDTGDALTIYGTLKYTSSATNDVTLRLKGNIKLTSGGGLQIGTEENPIVNTKFIIEANYSDSVSDSKYGIYFNVPDNEIALYGSSRSVTEDILVSDISAGDVSFQVNTTEWEVGDEVCIMSSNDALGGEIVTITGKGVNGVYYIDSNGDGTGTSPSFSNNHSAGDEAYNLFRTVEIIGYNDSYWHSRYDVYGYFYNVSFKKANYFYWKDTTRKMFGCVFRNGTNFNYWDKYYGLEIENCIFIDTRFGEGAYHQRFKNCSFLIVSPISDAWQMKNCLFDGCKFIGGNKTYYSSTRFTGTSTYLNCLFKNTYNVRQWYGAYYENCSFKNYGDVFHFERAMSYNYVLKNCTFENITGSIIPFSHTGAFSFVNCSYINVNSKFSGTINSIDGRDYAYFFAVPNVSFLNSNLWISYVLYGDFSSGTYRGITGHSGDCIVLSPTSSTNFLIVVPPHFARDFFNQINDYFTSFPVNSGKTITLSFWVKVSTSGFDGDLQIAAEGCGINYSWTSVDLTGADSDWVQRSFTLGTTTDKGFVRLKIRAKDGVGTSGDIYLDDFAITES